MDVLLSILYSVLIVSGIGAVLALILAVAEYFLANYGECTITINNEKELKIEGGRNLLSTLSGEKIFVPSACGGRGTCGLCKLKIHEGGGVLLPTEEPFLEKDERESNVRLSCQVKVRNDMKIEIPEELFNIREFTATCSMIRDLTHDIKLFRFELIEPAEIKYTPGHYVQLRVPKYGKNKEEVSRAYSIASDPAQKNIIDVIIRLVPGGICTTWCFEYLKEGDKVEMTGPYGDFRLTDTDEKMIFIAGGSGMAPFVSMLHDMRNTGNTRRASYYFGANKVHELFFLDEMKQFEQELENFTFTPVVFKPDDGEQWDGEQGLVTEAVGRNEKDASTCEGYLCGSPGMIDASIKVLTEELGMDNNKIYYDKFG